MVEHEAQKQVDEETSLGDPIVSKSLSWHIAVWTGLLLLSSLWALHFELVGRRPWIVYQKDFVEKYSSHLQKLKEGAAKRAKALQKDKTFIDQNAKIAELEKDLSAQSQQEQNEIAKLSKQIDDLSILVKPYQAEINQQIYQIELAKTDVQKKILREHVQEYKQDLRLLRFSDGHEESLSIIAMLERIEYFKEIRRGLQDKHASLLWNLNALYAERKQYRKYKLGLDAETIDKLLASMDDFDYEIHQTYVKDTQLIDRCETCHLGIGQPVNLPESAMGKLFASHPNENLLKVHDTERFGCSPCHGGNGIGLVSVDKAHGLNKDWMWPLRDKAHIEAGCLQCHQDELILDQAPVLSKGRELFRRKGCWGCHERKGYDIESTQLKEVAQQLVDLDARRLALEQTIAKWDRVMTAADSTDEQMAQAKLFLDILSKVEGVALDNEEGDLQMRKRSLLQSKKKVGPNLKELRAKVRPEWLFVWIQDQRSFRPDTKMPLFRFNKEEAEAITAFLWQSAIDENQYQIPIRRVQWSNTYRNGKRLFDEKGCLACHTIIRDGEKIGNGFAADLSRVGEKLAYEYLVRMIFDPRQRLLPYSPALGRDVFPADYREMNEVFDFSRDNSRCPQTGDEMIVDNMTVMPKVGLTWVEAEDIASYLMEQRDDPKAIYHEVTEFINDTELFKVGKELVRHLGCAGCHEIAGLEEDGLIGIDLTKIGAKPIERLDFGHLTDKAKENSWYNPQGFFAQKLKQPDLFDTGKEKEPMQRLRMPSFWSNLAEGSQDAKEVDAVTTFLLGSVEPSSLFPKQFVYEPDQRQKDIIAGWWVINKYNCTACHEILPGQQPSIQQLEAFKGKNLYLAPPSLVGQGFRTKPEWLSRFLKNPSMLKDLEPTDPVPNAIRGFMSIRMPDYGLSDIEVEVLVKFFAAQAKQPLLYRDTERVPLDAKELDVARAMFRESCYECHAVVPDDLRETVKAPVVLRMGERLNPNWMRIWMQDPQAVLPGSAMLKFFDKIEDEDRWVLKTQKSELIKNYKGDHVDLLLDYLYQFDEQEAKQYVKEKEEEEFK